MNLSWPVQGSDNPLNGADDGAEGDEHPPVPQHQENLLIEEVDR